MTEKIGLKYIFIELSTQCNFSCSFCPIDKITRPKGRMSIENVKWLLATISQSVINFVDITFSLQNEPFTYPKIIEVLKEAKRKNFKVNLPTNAMLLTPSLLSEILDLDIGQLIFSVQSYNEETFRHRTSRLDYTSYINQINNLVRIFINRMSNCSQTRKTILELHYMNTSQLKPNYNLIDSNELAISIIKEWQTFIKKEFIGDILFGEDDNVGDNIINIQNKHRYELLPNLFIVFVSAHNWANGVGEKVKKKNFECNIGLEQLCIGWNGDVTTCCLDYNFDNNIGNIFEYQDFFDFWYNSKIINFREKLKNNYPPSKFCKNCGGFLH